VTKQLRGRARLEAALSRSRLAEALEYFPGVNPVRNLEDALDRTGTDELRARFQALVEDARRPKSAPPEPEEPAPQPAERRSPEEIQRQRVAAQRATYARQRQAFLEDVEFMVDTGASRAEILDRLGIKRWPSLQERLHEAGRDDLVTRIRTSGE
jgi:hypothetical protein